MTEQWRAVPTWEDFYEVSDLGRIRSKDRRVVQRGQRGAVESFRPGRLLRPKTGAGGYLSVRLMDHQAARDEHQLVHRLVVRAFVREFKQGEETCHKNGNPADNRLLNLRIDTHKSNLADCVAHGTRLIGGKNHKAKLTEAEVRWALQTPLSNTEAAARLGVTAGAVWFIRQGKTWRHITGAA